MKRFAFPAVLASSVLLLAGCAGSSDAASTDESAASGEAVTLTHPTVEDLVIDFETQPENLILDCYAYSSLYDYGIEPVALFGYDCDNPFVMGDIDISGIERVGQDGEIDMEKVAELQPDAIVGNGTAEGWSWFDEDVNAQLMSVAPFVPLPSADTIDEGIAAVREVADFFGGDVDAESITSADADFEAAKESFAAAIGADSRSFLFSSPTKEALYTGVGFPAADLLEELGATIVGAPAPETGNPWGVVAWEEASTYPADIILVEGYSDDFAFSAELWDALPAVQDEQLGAWGSKGALTSQNYADWLNDITALVESSEGIA